MKSNYQLYSFEKSRERIDDILSTSDGSFEEVEKIPSRDKLTFTNGFYVTKTSALFIDIRDSSQLPDKYKRPTLARIYRSYISECVAVINGNDDCAEINIHGDSVWGVFDSEYKNQIDGVFSTAAQLSSIIDTLNCKYKKKRIEPLTVGIGMDFGRVLMIKAGYNGSGLNEVVWMGQVVNGASKLCSYGNKTWNDKEMMVSDVFYQNLSDNHKKLLSWNSRRSCWNGNVVDSVMNDWNNENCK
ncbi:adenylate/guanylate cyclase domain-containing protein [Sanyastnella coralliicola]|uniref:adenylate/guanylate cyclase domain-containing protein n=1 Tax=Sanyastnella coralliicola TaxID=3069118 RepID=UPI0027B96923|nr:adenylate/guanylate cyclase domain-containing protein [Longitalea sp. SCSIO 12813]